MVVWGGWRWEGEKVRRRGENGRKKGILRVREVGGKWVKK